MAKRMNDGVELIKTLAGKFVINNTDAGFATTLCSPAISGSLRVLIRLENTADAGPADDYARAFPARSQSHSLVR
jgi:hypothetical protein